MPFIGNTPSAVPLTSADIADGIITSAKIVDGTIVNADISASAAISGSKLSGAGFSGATTTSSAVDITLTNTSTQVQNVSITASDKAVILPDATTMTTKGFPAFVIVNNGLYPFDVKNAGGSSILTCYPSNSIELNLIGNSTASGIWAKEDAPINVSATPFTTVKTGTTGTPNLVFSWGTFKLSGISASAISSTEALITYHAGTSNRDIYGVVVSYSGTTITVNSETLLYSGTTTASINSQGLMLSSTNGFLFVQRASTHVVVPFTISGTTITAGTTSSTFGTGTSLTNSLGVAIAMTSTEALLPVRDNGGASTFVLRNIIHNGASAPTIGTASSSISEYDAGRGLCFLSQIDSTKAFLIYKAPVTAYNVARVVTISGSSAPTLGTANTSSAVDIADDGWMSNIFKVSSTEFIVTGDIGSENYTVSGTTVSYTGVQLHSVVNPSESGVRVHSYTVVELKFGDNFLTHGRDSSTFIIRTKLGSYLHVKQKGISFARSFSTNNTTSTYGSAWAVLDSTTGIGVTNNNGSTTISATIIKYIGS
jgi:hypothetical protein